MPADGWTEDGHCRAGVRELVDGIELVQPLSGADAISALINPSVVGLTSRGDAGIDTLPTTVDHPLQSSAQ